MRSSFILSFFLLSKIVAYGVQKLKGKLVIRKIEIIHALHIDSFVTHKRNPVDFSYSSCKKTMLSNVCCQKSNIARLRVNEIKKDRIEVFINFFPCV